MAADMNGADSFLVLLGMGLAIVIGALVAIQPRDEQHPVTGIADPFATAALSG